MNSGVERGRPIHSSASGTETIREGAAALLFASGERPDANALRQAVEKVGRITITHDLADGGGHNAHGVELLRDGMTYDVLGLAPAEPVTAPVIRYRYGILTELPVADLVAVALQPGPHLAAGAHSMPVIRTMSGIAASLAEALPGCLGVAWPPAQTVTGPTFFSANVAAWLEGGAFPALGLTAIADEFDGGMRSVGLAWFTGQEIRLAAELTKDRGAGARLAIRMINHLVLQGPLAESEAILGPDGGRLALEPTRDGATVRVRRA